MCSFTSFPNGASESPAILKCCFAKGMPIIVTNSNTPKTMCISHAHKPPKTIQRIFSGIRMHPEGLSVSFTSAPKGHRQSKPILNVCKATGMPMMVIAIARLPVKYPMAASRPQKSHHNRFPIIRICFYLFVSVYFTGPMCGMYGVFVVKRVTKIICFSDKP